MPDPSRLRVLAVMPGITPDAGAEVSFVDIVGGLTDAGIDLHLALLTGRHDLAPEVRAGGGVVHDLSASSTVLGRTRALRALIRELRPALLHATLYEATVPAQLAVVGLAPKVLVTWASTLYTPEHFAGNDAPRLKMRGVQAVEIALGHLASSRFHAVTSGVGRVTRSHLHVRADRVYVGERGRDPRRFEVGPNALQATRNSLALPPGARFLLAAGRQDAPKGYDLLLDAFDVLADTHPELHLRIAGRPGSATSSLLAQREQMRHGDRVEFLGQRADAAELMTLASAVVCTSLREGAAGALIEAMACGAPIVSVPLDGLEDVLIDGVNAVVVADRADLHRGLERVLSDPALAARISAGGRESFATRFTTERSALRLAEIYRAVDDGRPDRT